MTKSMLMPEQISADAVQILIVEDERAIALHLKDCLESLGYGVAGIAHDSQVAIAKVEALQPTLVLMDIMLEDSEQDGIQIAQEIRKRFKVPVVYLTAYANRSILEQVKATAPFGYLIKPFREKDLWVTLETALERYRLEKQLHLHQEWLDRILQGMGDGVIVFDASGRIQLINQAALTLIGCATEPILHQPIQSVLQICHEQTKVSLMPELLQLLDQETASRTPLQLVFDTLLTTRSGEHIPIAHSAAPLQDYHQQITGVVVVFRDIRSLQAMHEQQILAERSLYLEEHAAKLELLNRAKDEFLMTISHELRTPLSNIQLATEMLSLVLDQLGVLSARATESSITVERYLTILQEESKQQLILINNLLDLQRLNAGTYPLQPSQILLQDWLPHILESMESLCKDKDRQWLVAIPPDLPTLFTDAHVLTRIVTELVTNASKYTPPSMTIFLNVSLEAELSTQPQIQISIYNSGVEIPVDEQQKIFEPFYRLSPSDRLMVKGIGLGLTLVQGLTHILEGTIQVESANGQTCFHLNLPLAHSQS